MPGAIHIGTCAWSFDDWAGVFYPEHLPHQQRLAFYARYLNAVEIDSTFYAAPAESTARHWAGATPPDFAFTCKLSREITHDRRLRDSEALLSDFCLAISPLAPKLKCILVQLPPHFSPHEDEHALRDFVRRLPAQFRFAIEFRDPSWNAPRIATLLEEHDVCWVWNDLTPLDHRNEAAFALLPLTTDFIYVRLMGDLSAKYDPQREPVKYERLMWPRNASLESWAVRIQQHIGKVARVLVLCNNHFEGFAPMTCKRAAEQLQVELTLPEAARAEAAPSEGGQLELPL